MRVWTVAGACMALASLSGCGLPTAVTIASYAADGASFLSTGRSVTDHGISILLQKDCALIRIVRGKPICQPMKKDDLVYNIAFADRSYEYSDPDTHAAPRPQILVAEAKPVPKPIALTGPETFVAPQPAAVAPAVQAAAARPPPAQPPVRVAAVPIPPPAPGSPIPGYHVVAGAFDELKQAELRRAGIIAQLSRLGHSEVGVQIARLPKGNSATYVVLTRPVVPQDANLLVGQLQLDKGESPWKLRSGRSSL
jgi:hypothetical protein